jgi:hypothetical protein
VCAAAPTPCYVLAAQLHVPCRAVTKDILYKDALRHTLPLLSPAYTSLLYMPSDVPAPNTQHLPSVTCPACDAACAGDITATCQPHYAKPNPGSDVPNYNPQLQCAAGFCAVCHTRSKTTCKPYVAGTVYNARSNAMQYQWLQAARLQNAHSSSTAAAAAAIAAAMA